eukprot:Rhum_TRINITY_DN15013_c0_g3::Rhum_TRINITY_DN15013_c0_g3_i1::g.134942::m.134942
MMRLPLMAVFALAAATDPKPCKDDAACNKVEEFCRASANPTGACDAKLPMTCAKRSLRGERCGGGGGAAQDCFRQKCKAPLVCRENKSDKNLPGSCAKQCMVDGKPVFEGWTGPVDASDPTKWCQTHYCDGSGAKETGELKVNGAGKPCPVSLETGLLCCKEEEKKTGQVCCGATGEWLTPDGKVKCAYVVAKADSKGAPFSKTCKDACVVKNPPAPDAKYDDGWKGPNVAAGKWCNLCVCARGALKCPERPCPALKCCPTATKKANQVCCGVTGEWVTKDGENNVMCAGIKMPFAEGLAKEPFHAACAGARGCKVNSNFEKMIADGEKIDNPTKGKGCNKCTCTDGKMVCEKKECPAPKCCDAEDKLAATGVCCGLDGLWKAVDGTAQCGSHKTQVEGKAASGYPFFKACEPHCAVSTDVGGPDKKVPLGWSGPKVSVQTTGRNAQVTGATPAPWCDTCRCDIPAGAKLGTPPVLTCTTHNECPKVKCCPGKKPSGDWACCGVTRQWVKAVDGKVACGGHDDLAVASDKAPLSTECTLKCKLPGGGELGDGLSGPAGGSEWCKRCRCNGPSTTPQCTTNVCTKKCCAAKKPTLPGTTFLCCGASGEWVAKDKKTNTYKCGPHEITTGGPLFEGDTDAEKGVCPPKGETQCSLNNAGSTKVDMGYVGSGYGSTWCRTCKCRAEDGGKPVKCPTKPTCPPKEALHCCAKERAVDTDVCCGLTGEWVKPDAWCGAVNLKISGSTVVPITEACKTQCELEGGKKVDEGWSGQATGANWCNTCHCAKDGNLKCTAKKCDAITTLCCVGPKEANKACCGTTGKWVTSTAGKYPCGGLKAEEADTARLPFTSVCTKKCALPSGTEVGLGWWGEKGDNCNHCYCKDSGIACTERPCTPKPMPR